MISILVVDDNEDNIELLRRMIGRASGSSDITAAKNIKQARNLVQVEYFDLILLDIMLPDGTGVDFLKEVKSESALKKTPVVMISAENDKETVNECISNGAVDYLLKPFNRELVTARVNRYLASNKHETRNEAPSTILVVDDNELNRELLERRLIKYGYKVHQAENGVKALELMDRMKFNLVLLDIMMPEMDGLQVLKNIRSRRDMDNVSIIMLTALKSKEDVSECIKHGADDYIVKPFNAAILKTRIQSCLNSRNMVRGI